MHEHVYYQTCVSITFKLYCITNFSGKIEETKKKKNYYTIDFNL